MNITANIKLPTHFQVPLHDESWDEYFRTEATITSLVPDVKTEQIQEFTDVTGEIVCLIYTGELSDKENQDYIQDLREILF